MKKEFERTAMLLGTEGAEKLTHCHVAVFGAGGVGGHTIEALARSGVGEITVVDADRVSVTNLNRQIIATVDTVGMLKTDAAEERVHSINPDCVVNKMPVFVLPDNIGQFDFTKYDYVVDAIDTVSAKLALIKECTKVNTPIICAMGAGNKLDPTRFEVTDIYSTSVCPLAAVIRRECRKAGIPSLKVVYSREPALTPEFQPESENGEESRRATPASCAFVPSVCGLIIAGEVIKFLAQN